MKITRDVPGSRLTLEGDAPRIPPGAPSAILFVVSLPFFGYTLWSLPAVFAEGAEPGQRIAAFALSLFWFSLYFATARAMRQRGRWPTGVDADRTAGELRLRQSRYFGGVTPEAIIPLAQIEGITVRRTVKAPSLFDPLRPVKEGPGVALTFRIRGEGAFSGLESREVACGIEHLDRTEEVADLALRLGAATGLTFFRTVRSDTRDVEVELRRGIETGFREVPAGLGRADYAKDLVAAPARAIADTETVPPFEPKGFRGDHRIAVWTPGTEVRFRKPLSMFAIGCLPFTLLVFAGPLAFFFIRMVGATDGTETGSRLLVSVVLGLFGLLFGVIAMVAVASSLPRTALVDWTTRKVEVRTLTKRRQIVFDEVQAVEMKALHHLSTGKSPRHYYWCEVGLQVRNETTGDVAYEVLLATERLTDDPDAPPRIALPLATELAKALGVPRRVSDYS
jgi:hypothetical protein